MDMQTVIDLVTSTQQIVDHLQPGLEIHEKGTADYVTRIDLEIQTMLQEQLAILFPGTDFMGEEDNASTCLLDKPTWILDPIDGTTNLIHDYQTSAVSLALYEDGSITLGVVYNPFTKELYSAQRGKGAYLGSSRLHVSHAVSLAECLISFGTSPYYKELAPKLFPVFEKVYLECQDLRRCGSAALDLCHLAAGRIDAYFERRLKPWDYAAGSLILEEAGGCVSDWQGNPVQFAVPGDIAATNGAVQNALLSLLREGF